MKTFHIDGVEAIDLVKYCGASGDFNPIHTVESVAQEKGHPDVLVPGMMVMGWSSKAIKTWFPDRKINRLDVRFRAPVYPQESLEIVCTSTENTDGGKQRCSLEIIGPAGEKKMTGECEME